MTISWLCRYSIVFHKHIVSLFLCSVSGLRLSVSVFISVWCLSLCLYLSLCLFLFLFIALSVWLCLYLSCFCLPFSISLCLSQCLIRAQDNTRGASVCVCARYFPRQDPATFFILHQLFSPLITRGWDSVRRTFIVFLTWALLSWARWKMRVPLHGSFSTKSAL